MSSALRKLRIIALPLTRPNIKPPHPKEKPSRLVYYQFQLEVPVPPGDQDSGPRNAKKKGWLPKEGVVKWASNKAADTWAGYGKEKSGWKVCSVYWLNETR